MGNEIENNHSQMTNSSFCNTFITHTFHYICVPILNNPSQYLVAKSAYDHVFMTPYHRQSPAEFYKLKYPLFTILYEYSFNEREYYVKILHLEGNALTIAEFR